MEEAKFSRWLFIRTLDNSFNHFPPLAVNRRTSAANFQHGCKQST